MAACTNLSSNKQEAGQTDADMVRDGGPTTPVSVTHIPDAVPKSEPRTRAGNTSPYEVFGETYHVLADSRGYRQQGIASWYGSKFHGRPTANGERYDMYAMTAAHRSLPIPSYARVTNLENNRSIVVRINDRGPFHQERIIDLSYTAAVKLGFAKRGTAKVEVVTVEPAPQRTADVDGGGTAVEAPNLTPVRHVASAGAVPVENASPVSQGRFLQAGAFSSETSALALKDRIAGWTHYPVSVNGSASADNLFRVRIGPIADSGELMKLRRLLEEKQLATPHVVYD